VQGEVITGDTLHLFVVHAPSRFSGERASRPFRMQVARRLVASVDSLFLAHPGAWILVAGDFNDPISSIPMRFIMEHGLQSATNNVRGKHGAVSNYRDQGRWEQIDHVLVSPTLSSHVVESYVNDAPFLLEEDMKYGGVKPFRTYNGYRYQRGFSDHLPLVVRMSF
jgi:predicted extracellular nuclease